MVASRQLDTGWADTSFRPDADGDDRSLLPMIWLVDSTGAYPVRALAVGRNADRFNRLLQSNDWDNTNNNEDDPHDKKPTRRSWKTGKDGVRSLLSILIATLNENGSTSNGGARVEMAILGGPPPLRSNTFVRDGSLATKEVVSLKKNSFLGMVRLQLQDLWDDRHIDVVEWREDSVLLAPAFVNKDPLV